MNSTDGPSAALIRYVIGTDSYEEFVTTGAEVFIMLDLAARRYGNKSLVRFRKILDFGCGVGRILQFFPKGPLLFGCDIAGPAAEYAARAFPDAKIHRNDLMPPLLYPDNEFDLVYSFSVFSHLSQSVENAWLKELRRIGEANCLYLVTVHGDWVIEQTLGDDRAKAKAAGFFLKKTYKREGTEFDFPDYYEASYHTSKYIRKYWTEFFNIIAIIKGDDPRRYLFEKLRFAPEGSVPQLRPMGQDLVVMRKY
jgi:SAM-dependent methyltransferase